MNTDIRGMKRMIEEPHEDTPAKRRFPLPLFAQTLNTDSILISDPLMPPVDDTPSSEFWDYDRSIGDAENSATPNAADHVHNSQLSDPDDFQQDRTFIYSDRIPETVVSSESQRKSTPLEAGLQEAVGTICLGMISEAKCQQIDTPHGILPQDLDNALLGSDYVTLELCSQKDRCVVALVSIHNMANLNSRTALAIDKAKQLSSVCFRAYANKSELATTLASGPPAKGKPKLLHININVYGPTSQKDCIGSVLSEHGEFLQDPLWMEDDVEYSNPHMVKFEGLSDVDILLEELALKASRRKATEDNDWAVVLDDLPAYHKSSGETKNSLITTKLMRHQIDGQDFMLKREIGQLGDALKYWHRGVNDGGEPVYRHSVTQAEKSDCPPEPRGGLLGDDMGLGKTLTTISVIASSLDRASQFATSQQNQPYQRAFPTTPVKATLVVAPSMLILDGWVKEIEERTKAGALRITRYHGHERVRHFSELFGFDVVLTTYGTVTTEYRRSKSRKALYYLRWFRIVLDEAHTIRSQNTKQFEAIFSLQAEHHWCLTGTPISNKVDDLGALLRFCRVPLLEDRPCFRDNIVKTTRRSFAQGCRVLRQVLAPLCLRRTKNLLDLPKPKLVQCTITHSATESQIYRDLLQYCRRALDSSVSGQDASKARHTVLQSILRLRTFCNHGTYLPLVSDGGEEHLDADEELALLQEKDEACCSCCLSEVSLVNQLEDAYSGVIATCSHVFCSTCYKDNAHREDKANLQCPICNKTVEIKRFAQGQSFSSPSTLSLEKHSTKLQNLLENLAELQHQEKSLVFSSWKKTLDLTSELCRQKGIRHVCIDGKTPQPDRRRILQQFINDKATSTLLMTIGTGALGLNLTAATRIHIIEPQWNPAVEEQAIGRIVRIGQASNVTVIRYVVQNSVEEQIQGYQRRKIQLAAGGFGDSANTQAEAQTRLLTATFFRQT